MWVFFLHISDRYQFSLYRRVQFTSIFPVWYNTLSCAIPHPDIPIHTKSIPHIHLRWRFFLSDAPTFLTSGVTPSHCLTLLAGLRKATLSSATSLDPSASRATTLLKRLSAFSWITINICHQSQVELPSPSANDLLAIHDTGAYTMAMYCKWVEYSSLNSV